MGQYDRRKTRMLTHPTKLAGCNVASDMLLSKTTYVDYAEYIQLDLDQGLQGLATDRRC